MFTGLLKEEEGGGSYLPDPGQFTWSYSKEMFPTPKHFLTPYKPLGNGRLHELHCPPPFHSRPILGGASVEITGVLISTWQPSCHTWKTESHNKYNRKGRRLKHTHTLDEEIKLVTKEPSVGPKSWRERKYMEVDQTDTATISSVDILELGSQMNYKMV